MVVKVPLTREGIKACKALSSDGIEVNVTLCFSAAQALLAAKAGATFISPVINLPNAAILGVGALVDRPVVVDGEITVRTMLTLTLTCNHRIVYGADAAAYLATLRELLEQPERIALSL